jgi:hypothetical protein
VGLAGLCGDDDELADACPLLPRLYKFVHDPMKRSSSERRATRKAARRLMDPVLDNGSPQDAECLGEVVRQSLHNDGVTA